MRPLAPYEVGLECLRRWARLRWVQCFDPRVIVRRWLACTLDPYWARWPLLMVVQELYDLARWAIARPSLPRADERLRGEEGAGASRRHALPTSGSRAFDRHTSGQKSLIFAGLNHTPVFIVRESGWGPSTTGYSILRKNTHLNNLYNQCDRHWRL